MQCRDRCLGAVAATDAGSYFRIATPALNIRVDKSPLRFSVYRADNTTPVWSESQPLSWTGTQTSQYLTEGADEQFYGTGLRLGEWALRGKTVPVSVANTWKENTNASPAPFHTSTNGYGVMRNTWAPGTYTFGALGTFTHNESRFDAWYFVGDSLKGVLDGLHGRHRQAVPGTRTGLRARQRGLLERVQPRLHRRPQPAAPPDHARRGRLRHRRPRPRAGSCPTTATAAATPPR
ncbi:hypothetical protein ACIGN6_00365 [Streptomyces sp. NPDC053792]|uniref:hypothetical protein n=1 Tax=Streptomyces sp. NPDC053792 TaxID=3365716 RepID=UPI0037CD0515